MLNTFRNICIVTVFVLTLVDFTVQMDLFEDSLCWLHTGETGVCKSSRNCQWLIQNLNQRRMTFADIRRCSFTNIYEDIVCCGDDRPKDSYTEKPANWPCNLGFVFDSHQCVPQIGNPKPTPIPDKSNQNQLSGSKANAACANFSTYSFPTGIQGIIVGLPAMQAEFPHVVALGYFSGRNSIDFDCGGSLIAERWVVTAAHCIRDKRKPIIVRMGKLDLHEVDDSTAIDRNVLRTIRHPEYINSRKKNDIALVEFDENVEFTDSVHPACIRTDVNDISEDVEMKISGWGSIEADRTNRSKVLLKANVFTVPLEKCNETLIQFNQLSNLPSLRGLSKSQMCAVNRVTMSDACQGDSGGPLFFRESNGMQTIHGIVSFGISCGSDLPGVYTRIASYLDWIESTVWP